jgi:Protein of unknown function (DUF3298)
MRKIALVAFLAALPACSGRLETASDQAIRLNDAPAASASNVPAWVAAVTHESHEVADVELSYYAVHLPSARASETISRRLHDFAFANAAELEQAARDAASEMPELPRFSVKVSCDPKLVSADLLSIVCAVDTYQGGAHGLQTVETFNYAIDGDEVRAIGLDDLFLDAKAGRALVNDVCMTELRAQGAMWITEGDVQDLLDLVDTFHMEKSAIVVHFAPYAVGPYAQGEHVVEIPYPHLTGLRPAIALRLPKK